MENVTETIEGPEENVIDVEFGVPEEPSFHPILEVWQKVLEPAREERNAKVSPQWAVRITGTYPNLRFADMGTFRDLYFGHLVNLLEMLDEEIKSDKECLTYDSFEKDAFENAPHYRNLLRDWQVYILKQELAWEYDSPSAEVELAALSEVHKMFLGDQGITAFLDNIGFEFTDADQEELAAVLQAVRDEGVNGE